jgi:hypothetical protein
LRAPASKERDNTQVHLKHDTSVVVGIEKHPKRVHDAIALIGDDDATSLCAMDSSCLVRQDPAQPQRMRGDVDLGLEEHVCALVGEVIELVEVGEGQRLRNLAGRQRRRAVARLRVRELRANVRRQVRFLRVKVNQGRCQDVFVSLCKA